MPTGTQLEYRCLPGVEIDHVEVEMRLLSGPN